MRSQTFGVPGTIGVEVRRRYYAWCAGCNSEFVDVCPSRSHFEATIKRFGWVKVAKCWYCCRAHARIVAERESERE